MTTASPSPAAGASTDATHTAHGATDRVVVFDGGLATTLEAAGHDLSGPLWSARLLRDDPQAIVAAHRAFLAAGAQVITTASYQLSARGLAAVGADPAEVDRLLARSVELAREAVAAHETATSPSPPSDGRSTAGTQPTSPTAASPSSLRVAASVGPFGAVLADGSEYRGGYGVGVDELEAFHGPRVAALVAAAPDLLAVETIPSGDELTALARVLAHVEIPAWVSVTLGPDGVTTPEGQPLLEALAPVLELDAVVAVGVNCCPPAMATRALQLLGPAAAHPLVVYPNVGDTWDAVARRWVAGPGGDAGAEVAAWHRSGARLIGGCCGTTPDHLRRLVAAIATL
jgi:homocysteine S-methyltransferase